MKKESAPCRCSGDAPCCGHLDPRSKQKWITVYREIGEGKIPVVSTRLRFQDRLGSWKARWGINRNRFTVPPGLYGIGTPDGDSPVLVTANYKMSFDRLRSGCDGLNAWILVLDTRGINVWCAAGKGTFGTEELIERISLTGLHRVVSHRQLILPQLSGPGVASHLVKKMTGFQVIWGPIRAHDLKRFLYNNLEADERMRRITFSLKERLILIPMEVIPALKLFPIFVILLTLPYLIRWHSPGTDFLRDILMLVIAIITGSVLIQLLLPWVPFRSLALKGWILGLMMTLIATSLLGVTGLVRIAYLFLVPPLASFLALNFTGSTPYTSLSGVQKEIAISLPLVLVSFITGIILMTIQ